MSLPDRYISRSSLARLPPLMTEWFDQAAQLSPRRDARLDRDEVARFVDAMSEEAAAALEAVLDYAGKDALTGPAFQRELDAMMGELISAARMDGYASELSYSERATLSDPLAALTTAALEYIGDEQ
jgi:hypothetical protein